MSSQLIAQRSLRSRTSLHASVICASVALLTANAVLTMVPAHAVVRLNEIYYSPEIPEDGRQFIELRSTTGGVESVENLWILEIDGDTEAGFFDNAGEILTVINLGAATAGIDTTGSNGLFLWRDQSVVLDTSQLPGVQGPAPGTTVYINDHFPGREDLGYEFPPPMETENNVPTFLLVEGFSGNLNDDLDTNNDGIFDSMPWTAVVDSLSWNEVGDPGFLYAEQFGGASSIFSGSFGADVASFDPVEEIWAFYDSGSGENNAAFVGPFSANDGFGWFSPSGSDAQLQDGRRIVVGADSTYLHTTPGVENLSAVGGLLRGDTDHDGDVDADDIDLLIANLGVVGTSFDVAGNGGRANQTDLNWLVRNVLGTEYGDANLDGVVDGLDYQAWRAGFGSDGGWAAGDFSGDGIVNAAGYTVWRDNLGAGSASSNFASAVPEPATAIGFMIAAMSLAIRAKRNLS